MVYSSVRANFGSPTLFNVFLVIFIAKSHLLSVILDTHGFAASTPDTSINFADAHIMVRQCVYKSQVWRGSPAN
jgi:hypothetical protein